MNVCARGAIFGTAREGCGFFLPGQACGSSPGIGRGNLSFTSALSSGAKPDASEEFSLELILSRQDRESGDSR